jgi:NitT/TauT family transport system substrate-binding protein
MDEGIEIAVASFDMTGNGLTGMGSRSGVGQSWIATGLALMTLCVCVPEAPAQGVVGEKLHKVSVGILYLIADASLFIAKDRGYFAEQGLDVQLTRFASGSDIVALLATNRVDVGSGSASPGLFNAFRRGIDVKIVASKSNMIAPDLGSGALLVRSDLTDSGQVKSIADLKGRRIAINNIQSTSFNYTLRALAAGGLTRDDVKLVELPFGQFIPALQNKAVDAAMAYAPLSDAIVGKMDLARALPESSTVRTSEGDTTNLMFYSPGFAATNDAQRFMVAYLKGARDYYQVIVQHRGSPTEICQILSAYLDGVPVDCVGITMSGVEPDGNVNVASLERYQKEWIEWGVMREPSDIRKNIDTSFVEYAWSKLGKF